MEINPQGDLLQPSQSVEQPKPFAAPVAESVESKLDTFHSVLCVTIVALILTNLAVVGVFLWETKQVRQRLEQSRQLLARYHRLEEPLVKDVLTKLAGYSQQDHDFQAVLHKYPNLFGPSAPPAPGTVPKTPALAPAMPSAPAKRPAR